MSEIVGDMIGVVAEDFANMLSDRVASAAFPSSMLGGR